MNVTAVRRLVPILAVLLTATGFRFAALHDSPPGWRDDELIEFDMAVRIRDGWRPLYIAEAEGHEPLFHYLQAATIALFGENVAGYKWLSMAFGVLTAALTYALARRLFGARVAIVAAALMAASFWPILYARIGLRHIGLLPWMLGGYLAVTRLLPDSPAQDTPATPSGLPPRSGGHGQASTSKQILLAIAGGLCLAGGLMTYFAGRVAPVVVIAFAVYFAFLHRAAFRRAWPGILAVLAIGLALSTPMFVEINRLLPEGEQRLAVVGPQLDELRAGNLRPAIETTIGTLGMFTFRGDPEALYNIEGRPVFDWLTGAFLYAGLAFALWRWRRAAYGFTLIGLGLGLAPAFVSNPPASFSHTIAAMPFVYVLAGLGLVEVVSWLIPRLGREGDKAPVWPLGLATISVVLLNVFLTARDYFGAWAHDDYVRFLYHAPIREIAGWLDEHHDVADVSIGTHPNYLWLDPLALRLDLVRDDVRARWFDPEAALVLPPDGILFITPLRAMVDQLETLGQHLADCPLSSFPVRGASDLKAYRLQCRALEKEPLASFDDALDLVESWSDLPPIRPGDVDHFFLVWQAQLAGLAPRLKLLFHVLDDQNQVLVAGDRQDINMASVYPGDRLLQLIQLQLPDDLRDGEYPVLVGWYHPDTGVRLLLPDGADRYDIGPLYVER